MTGRIDRRRLKKGFDGVALRLVLLLLSPSTPLPSVLMSEALAMVRRRALLGKVREVILAVGGRAWMCAIWLCGRG